MEVLDLYDSNRTPLNKTIKRFDHIGEEEYCLVVGVWVLNSKGEILVTLRANDKNTYPNKWENTAGAVQSGENTLQGAVRELFEETGIKANEEDFVKIHEVREKTAFVDNYVLCKDVNLNDIVFLEGETQDAKLVTFEEFQNMIDEDIVARPVVKRFYEVHDDLLSISKEIYK